MYFDLYQLFPELFINYLYLLIEHLACEAVDSHVHPVVLFSFDNEIVLKAGSIWLVVTRLRYDVNQQVPNATLRHRRSTTRNNFPSGLDGLIIIRRCR